MKIKPGQEIIFNRNLDKLNISVIKPFGLKRIFVYNIDRKTETSMSYLYMLPENTESATVVDVEFAYLSDYEPGLRWCQAVVAPEASIWSVVKEMIRQLRKDLRVKFNA